MKMIVFIVLLAVIILFLNHLLEALVLKCWGDGPVGKVYAMQA